MVWQKPCKESDCDFKYKKPSVLDFHFNRCNLKCQIQESMYA